MSERSEWEPVPTEESVSRLSEPGILSEAMAEAFVLRELDSVPRKAAAELLGIGPSALDDRVQRAKHKIEAAEETVTIVEELRHRPIPGECAICERGLGGRWITDENGNALCFGCADVDAQEVRVGGG